MALGRWRFATPLYNNNMHNNMHNMHMLPLWSPSTSPIPVATVTMVVMEVSKAEYIRKLKSSALLLDGAASLDTEFAYVFGPDGTGSQNHTACARMH